MQKCIICSNMFEKNIHNKKCCSKKCSKTYNKNYQQSDKYKQYKKEYQQTEEYKKNHKISLDKYRKTEKSRETQRKYSKTDKYKKYRRMYGPKYEKTEKRKAYRKKWETSSKRQKYLKDYKKTEKSKAHAKEYGKSQKGTAARRKYQQTDKYKKYQKRYRNEDENRLIQNKRQRIWRKTPIGRFHGRMHHIRRREAENNCIHAWSKEEWKQKTDACKGICPCCYKLFDDGEYRLSLDHTPSISKANENFKLTGIKQIYTIDNVAPLCLRCNIIKNDKDITIEELRKIIIN